jgi:hypothetical protein
MEIMRVFLPILALLYLLPALLPAQCDTTESSVLVRILTDAYPGETTWSITADGELLASGGPYDTPGEVFETNLCIPKESCVLFTIEDSFGDGICCGYGEGNYKVYVNGALSAEGGAFGDEETSYIDCPQGTNCASAFIAEEGVSSTPLEGNNWYVYTPDSTGNYLITTCDQGNSCDPAIWVYDYCTGLVWDNSVQSTIYFNDDFCDEQASVTALFEGGTTYYIRIGDLDGNCDPTGINWLLEYSGPVTGCMDPDACNYNPLATIDSGDCIYPGNPDCPEGPDLIVMESDFINSLQLDYITNNDNCLIEEGCVNGYGQREIIRFTTRIENIGTFDYYIGVPPSNPDIPDEQWEWDACHTHWHYEGYAEYIVYDLDGTAIPIGFKNGFCVIDLDCSYGGGTPKYGCSNQGISAGCGDIYDSYLSCQWIDITDLEEGIYTFVIRVNWDQSPDALGNIEMDYNNNWAQVCLDITRDEVTNAASFTVIDDCAPYVDCTGEIYGSAQPDCTGECAGTRVTGDIDLDTMRTSDDMYQYINEILLDTIDPTICLDLNADELLTITDVNLLLECLLHEGSPALPGHSHSPCEFPFNVTNPSDTVTLSIGEINQSDQYVDIELLNPYNKVAAFEFELEGLIIDQIDNLIPDFTASIFHDATEIAGISFEEDVLEKHNEPIPFIRVHYAELTTDELICISEITAINNDVREQVITKTGDCKEVISGTNDLFRSDLNAQVVPNPFSQSAQLRFHNPSQLAYTIEILDATGRMLKRWEDVRSNELQLDAKEWSRGMYFYRISGKRAQTSGKFLIE